MAITLCGCGKASDDSPEPKADQLQLVTLNPDEYRQEITDIDRAVFGAEPFDDARHELLAANLEKLAQRLKSDGDSRFLKMEADEIMTLARMSRKMREEGLRTQLPNHGCASATIFSRIVTGLRAVPPISSSHPKPRREGWFLHFDVQPRYHSYPSNSC
jgi:hypothetical protein